MNELNPKFKDFTNENIKNLMMTMKIKNYKELGNFTIEEVTQEWQSRAFNVMNKFMTATSKGTK